MANSKFRALLTTALVVAAGCLAFLGRLALDRLIGVAPNWEQEIERIGGGVLGMVVGLLVVIPVFRMYGVFDREQGGAKLRSSTSKGGGMTKRK